MFETQKPRTKLSSEENGLNTRTYVSSNAGLDQASGGVSVPCWHTAPVANISLETSHNEIKSLIR